MTDEEYYEFIQPYEDAKQMLLTRLDVLNHNLYGDASARPIHTTSNAGSRRNRALKRNCSEREKNLL